MQADVNRIAWDAIWIDCHKERVHPSTDFHQIACFVKIDAIRNTREIVLCRNLEAGWRESREAAREAADFWKHEFEGCIGDLEKHCQVGTSLSKAHHSLSNEVHVFGR